jgi:hypothetical protein
MADWINMLENSIPAVIAFTVVGLSSYFAERRDRNSSLWNRKAIAYSDIFGALGTMLRSYDEDIATMERNGQKSSADLIDEKKYRIARETLHTVLSKETWLLPSTVKSELSKMEKAMSSPYHSDMYEMLESGSTAISVAEKAIREIARQDQRVK